MRYRTKLLLVLLGVTLITNGISLAVLDRLSLNHLREAYRAKLLSITESIAATIDADALEQVQAQDDRSSPEYRRLRETLRRARDANRRPDTYMKRVFTVMRSPRDRSVLLLGVDAEEGPAAAHPGEPYRTGSSAAPDIQHASVGEDFITDEFGSFLRSFAPVRDSSGRLVGAVAVEATEKAVESRMRPQRIAALLTMVLATAITIPAALFLSRRVSQPLVELHNAAMRIGKGDFDTPVHTSGKRDEFGELAHAMNGMAAGLKERDRVKTTFAHYVSQQVMDSILSSGAEVKLSGDRKRITVLFCDIRGFSTISERLPPEKVVMLLNDYFEAMVEVIFRYNGTLDKFIGDGIMVIFGAPEDDVYQEEHALRAAIEMQRELNKLAEKWKPQGIGIRIGIGINSGPAVVGNIGSSRRMDYTAIGDTVNLASRLESATKDLGVGIVISEYTYNALRGSFRFRETGSVQVRGRTDPVLTYTPEDA